MFQAKGSSAWPWLTTIVCGHVPQELAQAAAPSAVTSLGLKFRPQAQPSPWQTRLLADAAALQVLKFKTHTHMHACTTHTRTLAHLSPSACCFTQARYWYRNQAPEFLATSVVTQAYRHAIQEAALYAATSEAPQASEGGDMMMDHSMLRRHRKLAEEMDMDHDADMDTGMGGPGGGHTGGMSTGNEERTIAGMATRWGTPGRVQVAGQIPLAELWLLDLDSWRLLALGGRGAHAQPSSAPTWL